MVLSDGSIFHGIGFGAKATTVGELVFNTSMVGYQEALTDPSYAGQILLMTYPLIGNYGISKGSYESKGIHARAFVVHELCATPVHNESVETVDGFLARNEVPGICGIDTRAVVRRIRSAGVMPASICTYSEKPNIEKLLEEARALDYSKINFVESVSVKNKTEWLAENEKKRIVLIDCGAKESIIRELIKREVSVCALPWNATTEEIMNQKPDGLVISNGPGDPALLENVANNIKPLLSRMPVFGICLGHQILGHAVGGRTFKLKFGHRGANHPVKNLETGRVCITSQNHGFAVDPSSLPPEYIATHVNLNDKTNEGMRHKELPVFSVQYHPEANPGPYDSRELFDKFCKMMEEF